MAPRRYRRPARRQNRQSRRGRGSQRRTRTNNRSVLPPARSILGHIMRNIIQTAYDIANSKVSNQQVPHRIHRHLDLGAEGPTNIDMDIDSKTLLGDWKDRLKPCFRQYKVHRITVHYMPYAPVFAPGEYILTVSDANENITPSKSNKVQVFDKLIGTPASVVRKMGQPAKLVWYPTEPDDRNWHTFDDGHNICNIELRSAEDDFVVPAFYSKGEDKQETYHGDISGKLICEVDASFRGVPLPDKADALALPDKCFCRKCLRRDYFIEHLKKHLEQTVLCRRVRAATLAYLEGSTGDPGEPAACRSIDDSPMDPGSVSESQSSFEELPKN